MLLSNFNSSLETNSLPRALARFAKIHKLYLGEKAKKYEHPVVTNINSFVGQIVEDRRCFIVVDNFQNVNMYRSEFPLVLRFPIPYVIRELSYDDLVTFRIVFGSGADPQKNLTSDYHISCPAYFAEDFKQAYCMSINFTEFSLKAKPSTCAIQLGIFQPAYMTQFENSFSATQFFHLQLVNLPREMQTPSSGLKINAMITQQEDEEADPWTFTKLRSWITSTFSMSPYLYMHDVFIILRIPSIQGATLSGVDKLSKIMTYDILKICPGCLDGDAFGKLIRIRMHRFDLKLLENQFFVTPSERLIWATRETLSGQDILLERVMQQAKTSISYAYKELWTNIFLSGNPLEKVAIAHSTVWKSVMKNYTFFGEGNPRWWKIRPNFIISVEYHQYKSSLLVFPYYTANTFKSLRFIGCGTQGVSSIPFYELTRVFDKIIWLGVILTTLITSKLLQLLCRSTSAMSHMFSVVQIFLEQGTPIKSSVEKVKPTRCIIGLLLLMGIVVSNAYKNTNIYNMVQPRKQIPYRYFKELLRDKFEILTRPSHILISLFAPPKVELDKLDAQIAGQQTYLMTETVSALQLESDGSATSDTFETATRTGLITAVLKAAKMHPDMIKTCSKYLQEENFTRRVDWWDAQFDLAKQFARKQFLETETLFKIVEKCQKIAVVLPDHVGRKYYLMSKLPHVFIGQESYYDKDYMFYLRGIVPPHLIKRIHRIAESGVWQWWIKLFSGGNFKKQLTEHVKAARLDGNIVIIFAVLVFGICLATLGYFMENCKHIVGSLNRSTRFIVEVPNFRHSNHLILRIPS